MRASDLFLALIVATVLLRAIAGSVEGATEQPELSSVRMTHMMRTLYVLPSALVLMLFAAAVSLRAQDARIQRGKYLVEEIGRCQECHTPKTDAGELDRSKWLKGAKLEVAPIAPIQGWHATSPDITSTSALWTRWGADGMVTFLETAKNPRGGKAGAPMPAYALQHDDADAIVAYLKSLP